MEKTWAREIRNARRLLRMTQLAFAFALDTTPVTIWRWEQGRCAPDPYARQGIRDALAMLAGPKARRMP